MNATEYGQAYAKMNAHQKDTLLAKLREELSPEDYKVTAAFLAMFDMFTDIDKYNAIKEAIKTEVVKEIFGDHDGKSNDNDVKHGHWVHCNGESKLWYCSECGSKILYNPKKSVYNTPRVPVNEKNKYCRTCGALMDGEPVHYETEGKTIWQLTH